jgi:glucan phosphoethanolaminetransferase (alkaline phosphatase superfamily)
MADHVTPTPARNATASQVSWWSSAMASRVLAVITAALLAVDAYVHLRYASQYDSFKSSVMSEGTLFRIQGVVAIVVAVALLIWPRVLTWVLAILVSGSAVVAVVLYTYVNVGPLGPLPNLYENTWSPPGKVPSAVAEGAACLVAIAGLVLALRARRRSAH